jgi:hypothetical protein
MEIFTIDVKSSILNLTQDILYIQGSKPFSKSILDELCRTNTNINYIKLKDISLFNTTKEEIDTYIHSNETIAYSKYTGNDKCILFIEKQRKQTSTLDNYLNSGSKTNFNFIVLDCNTNICEIIEGSENTLNSAEYLLIRKSYDNDFENNIETEDFIKDFIQSKTNFKFRFTCVNLDGKPALFFTNYKRSSKHLCQPILTNSNLFSHLFKIAHSFVLSKRNNLKLVLPSFISENGLFKDVEVLSKDDHRRWHTMVYTDPDHIVHLSPPSNQHIKVEGDYKHPDYILGGYLEEFVKLLGLQTIPSRNQSATLIFITIENSKDTIDKIREQMELLLINNPMIHFTFVVKEEWREQVENELIMSFGTRARGFILPSDVKDLQVLMYSQIFSSMILDGSDCSVWSWLLNKDGLQSVTSTRKIGVREIYVPIL